MHTYWHALQVISVTLKIYKNIKIFVFFPLEISKHLLLLFVLIPASLLCVQTVFFTIIFLSYQSALGAILNHESFKFIVLDRRSICNGDLVWKDWKYLFHVLFQKRVWPFLFYLDYSHFTNIMLSDAFNVHAQNNVHSLFCNSYFFNEIFSAKQARHG